ncbi:MAG: YraN family protein [Flavobacteriales bacterium]|jgi:putative endonuclease
MDANSETTRQKGMRAEDLAAQHLEKKGYRILQRNWTVGKLEIDLIASNASNLLFVEVKSRASDQFGAPLEAVNSAKRKSIVKAADIYLKRTDTTLEPRFDIVSIIMTPQPQIEHIEGAFFPYT